jgi:hypothetical protein
MKNKLSDIMPSGESKDDLILKMRQLFLCEYKGHKDQFMCTMCEMIDIESLKKIYLYLEENKL